MSIKKYNSKTGQISQRLIDTLTNIIPEISKKTGWKDQVIRRWVNGSLPGLDKIEELCRAAGISVRWLLTGEEQPDPVLTIQVTTQIDKGILNGSADDYRGIPLYESGRLAAGVNGIEFDPYEAPASVVVVYKPELQGRSRHDLAAIKVGGDSMEPTIINGSIVVVDLSDRDQAENRVFVVNTPEGGMDMASIKRVQKFEKGFLLLSDNRNFPPVYSPLDWNRLCVGRVVWMWRDIRNI